MSDPDAEALATIERLLDERGPCKTICPSEAARAMAVQGDHWRARMDDIHAAVDMMLRRGTITLSWKGLPLDGRKGPYRIARRQPDAAR